MTRNILILTTILCAPYCTAWLLVSLTQWGMQSALTDLMAADAIPNAIATTVEKVWLIGFGLALFLYGAFGEFRERVQ